MTFTFTHSSFVPACIRNLTRSLYHVRNTRKDNYSVYARNTPPTLMRRKSQLFTSYLFVCFAFIRNMRSSFLLPFAPYARLCHSHSLTHVRSPSLYTRETDNIQFDASYTRELRFRPLARTCAFYIHNTYIYVHINSRILLKVCTYEV